MTNIGEVSNTAISCQAKPPGQYVFMEISASSSDAAANTDVELQIPSEPTLLSMQRPNDSTVGGVVGRDGEDFRLIRDFKAGTDKLIFCFETNGFVGDDVQKEIDAAIRDKTQFFRTQNGQ
jgi:hypothetical protein